MRKKLVNNIKVPAKAKKRAAQVNMMQRSSDEMGKFDNTSATSISMGITAVMGLGIEIGFYLFVLLFRISTSTQIISDYFYERGWVPYVLTYLACWSFAILFLKRKKLKGQLNIMQFKLLPEDISQDIKVENLPQFAAHISRLGFDPRQSFLLTRIFRGLEHFSVRKNHTETADMLKSQSEIDATMVDSSYVLIKVFIWAIPILGFIGTVLGISDAVSSFGGEMGAAADIEVIKEQLGQVTGGLSEAFDTTLVSLIFSLWVMFPTSVMQKNEEDLLNKVDEYCNEYFLKRLREPHGEVGSAGSGETIERIENLQAYLLQLQESQSVVAQQMTQVANQFNQIMENASIEEGNGS
ncbi:MotA/TolQ/ExbB proton channel family protein [Opitutales bacterium]|nr:MotA/TolQ/ExbB proton channel family protein [Opitutales bacterium]